MKKSFSIIIALITVSLLGIVFIQVSWITNSYKVKTEELRQRVTIAANNISERIILEKANRYSQLSTPFNLFNNVISIKKIFNNFEIKNIITNELKKGNVQLNFEYSVKDAYEKEIMVSAGFKSEFYGSVNMVSIPLSSPKSNAPEYMFLFFERPEYYVQQKIIGLLISSILFTIVIISAFVLTIRTLLKQKKISEIKNDFIANMTHEFKTPLATISLATDALRNEKVKHDPEKMEYYTDIIKEENKRMNAQVETILQAAQFEKQEIKLNLKKINVHEVINTVYENTIITIEEKQGQLTTKLKATNPIIKADEVHFSNIIFNLLDNAIKYSKEVPEIAIETENVSDHIHIKFMDNGIGMNRDILNNIFEKFYRAHTGNLHNVKGFGLGLTYVKQIVDAHHGKIKVASTLGKGSTFTLIFDLA